MTLTTRMVHYVDQLMQRSLAGASHQLVIVGLLAFLGFPLLYWSWGIYFPQPYHNLGLNLLGSLLGLGLISAPYWPSLINS